jgi:hypothetical protein
MLRKGKPFASVMDGYAPFPYLTADARPRLLDLAAIRYLVASPPARILDDLPLREIPGATPHFRVFSNDHVLPRARYVPRIEVIPDDKALLRRLAFGDDDLAAVAFVNERPASGFMGAGEGARGTVRFIGNDPEHLSFEVEVRQPGFLLLADTYYPGWHATVDGTPVPIMRANHLFRLVEVPAGTTLVEFRYRPTHLALGGAISGLTSVFLATVLWRGRRRRMP